MSTSEGQEFLDQASPGEFALRMAEGEGDYDWSAVPEGENGRHFVPSLDVAFPQWDDVFLKKVQSALADRWQEIADSALSVEGEQSREDGPTDHAIVDELLLRIGRVVVEQTAEERRAPRRARAYRSLRSKSR